MKPVLLLVPGMLNDASVWDDVVPKLEPLAQVRSVPVVAQDSVPAMAAAAWQLVADVPRSTPVVLAGFSLGGYVTLQMLAQPAREPAAVAFVSTSARADTPDAVARRHALIAGLQADFPQAVDGILQWGTHQAPAALVDRLRTMMLRVGSDVAVRQSRAIVARLDHRALLPQLSMPVAVVCGEQDRMTPPKLSQEIASLVPGAQLTLVEGAGHLLPAERPQAVAQALSQLLARVAATND